MAVMHHFLAYNPDVFFSSFHHSDLLVPLHHHECEVSEDPVDIRDQIFLGFPGQCNLVRMDCYAFACNKQDYYVWLRLCRLVK